MKFVWPGLCGLVLWGATAAQAIEVAAAPPFPAAPIHEAQYAGPMDGGPFYGGPGSDGPGYGMPPGAYRGGGPGLGQPGMRRREAAGPHRYVGYHGFRIDVGAIEGVMDTGSAVAAVEHQIDIVDRAGLSPPMLALFRSFPVRISAAFAGGSHYSGGSEVMLGSITPGDDRPVLLHEYMHVLNFRRLPGGAHNATIRHFYAEAAARGLYEPGSYMMSNPAEFFAVTASCFLHGTVAREPYTRAAIRERQPDYYAYLSRLFGQNGEASAGSPKLLHAGAVAAAAR